ncbi:hypothetical protein D3C80_1691600 [compost metagenome]
MYHKFKFAVADIRSNLDQQAFAGTALAVLDRHLLLHLREQLRQLTAMLQTAQVRRVRRADINHKKITVRIQRADTLAVILMRCFIRSGFVAPDIDRYRYSALLKPFQAIRHRLSAFIIEAHPVDERFVRNQAEQSWTVVARLPYRRYCADFHKSEADG